MRLSPHSGQDGLLVGTAVLGGQLAERLLRQVPAVATALAQARLDVVVFRAESAVGWWGRERLQLAPALQQAERAYTALGRPGRAPLFVAEGRGQAAIQQLRARSPVATSGMYLGLLVPGEGGVLFQGMDGALFRGAAWEPLSAWCLRQITQYPGAV